MFQRWNVNTLQITTLELHAQVEEKERIPLGTSPSNLTLQVKQYQEEFWVRNKNILNSCIYNVLWNWGSNHDEVKSNSHLAAISVYLSNRMNRRYWRSMNRWSRINFLNRLGLSYLNLEALEMRTRKESLSMIADECKSFCNLSLSHFFDTIKQRENCKTWQMKWLLAKIITMKIFLGRCEILVPSGLCKALLTFLWYEKRVKNQRIAKYNEIIRNNSKGVSLFHSNGIKFKLLFFINRTNPNFKKIVYDVWSKLTF